MDHCHHSDTTQHQGEQRRNIFGGNFKTTLIDGGSQAIIPSKYRRLAFWSLSVNKEPFDAVPKGKGEKQEIFLLNMIYFIPPPFTFFRGILEGIFPAGRIRNSSCVLTDPHWVGEVSEILITGDHSLSLSLSVWSNVAENIN